MSPLYNPTTLGGDLEGTASAAVLVARPGANNLLPTARGYKFQSFDPGDASSTVSLASGLVLIQRVETPGPSQSITNVMVGLISAAATVTGAGAWVYAWGPTGTLLATSVDQTTAWTTAGNIVATSAAPVTAAMSFSTVADSWIWVGVHVPSATTYPSFGRKAVTGSNNMMNLGLDGSHTMFNDLTAQAAKVTTALTLPFGANGAGGTLMWVALS